MGVTLLGMLNMRAFTTAAEPEAEPVQALLKRLPAVSGQHGSNWQLLTAICMPWRTTICGQLIKKAAAGSKDRDLGRVPPAPT